MSRMCLFKKERLLQKIQEKGSSLQEVPKALNFFHKVYL